MQTGSLEDLPSEKRHCLCLWSMVCKIPYESFRDATILQNGMGIEMRFRSAKIGRPMLSSQMHRFFLMCKAAARNMRPDASSWLLSRCCVACDCEPRTSKDAEQLKECAFCLRVYHAGSCFTRVWPGADIPPAHSMALPPLLKTSSVCGLCLALLRD